MKRLGGRVGFYPTGRRSKGESRVSVRSHVTAEMVEWRRLDALHAAEEVDRLVDSVDRGDLAGLGPRDRTPRGWDAP